MRGEWLVSTWQWRWWVVTDNRRRRWPCLILDITPPLTPPGPLPGRLLNTSFPDPVDISTDIRQILSSSLYKSQGCPDTLAALHLRPIWQHFTILSSCGNECVLIWLIPDTDHVYHQLPSVTLTLLQSLVSCIPSGSHEGSGSLGYFYTFIGVGGNKQQKPDPAHTERKMINFIAVFLTSAVNYF